MCFINAYANDANEQRAAELLAEVLPDVRISTSASVLPELFEHERFSTTVANAVLSPRNAQPLLGWHLRSSRKTASASAGRFAASNSLPRRGRTGKMMSLGSLYDSLSSSVTARLSSAMACSGFHCRYHQT